MLEQASLAIYMLLTEYIYEIYICSLNVVFVDSVVGVEEALFMSLN